MSLKQRIVARLNRAPWMGGRDRGSRGAPAAQPSSLFVSTPVVGNGERETAFLQSLPWEGLTVYDVGGDQGSYAIFFARRVGMAGRVVVFEPHRGSCERIEQRVTVNGFQNVRIIPVGLGEQRETVEFTIPCRDPSRGTAIGSIGPCIRADGDGEVSRVEINSLDDEIRSCDLPAPDFIKLDIEGMEYAALRGMRKTIRTHRPRLFIEMHGCASLEERTGSPRGVVALLESQGYRLRRIESGEVVHSTAAASVRSGHYYCVPVP